MSDVTITAMETHSAELGPAMPWRVRVVGLAIVIIGVESLASIAVAMYFDRLHLSLCGLILLPVGLAMLRGSRTAQWWAHAILVLTAAGLGLGVVIAGAAIVTEAFGDSWPTDPPMFSWGGTSTPTSWYAAGGGMLITLAAVVWATRALNRVDANRFFRILPPGTRLDRATRRQIWIACAVGVLLSVGGLALALSVSPSEDNETFISTGDAMYGVHYGYRGGGLAYVVFQFSDGGRPIAGVTQTHPREYFVTLGLPDGGQLRLPGEHQLHEIRNGVLTTSPRRVTRQQFEAFLASDPESREHTLADLLRFVDAQSVAATSEGGAAADTLLIDERFDGMADWWVEGGRSVKVVDGRLHVDADPTEGELGNRGNRGRVATVWHRRPIEGDVKVTFDAHVVSSSVHANNINLFLFYSDPAGRPLEETADQRADADYGKYHPLNGYIFTFVNEPPPPEVKAGAELEDKEGGPARVRIRRCPGFKLLAETREYHCRAGHTYHFEITRRGGKLTISVDGKHLLTAEDPHPHRAGHLGLRTFRTHLWWDNVKVERVPAGEVKQNATGRITTRGF